MIDVWEVHCSYITCRRNFWTHIQRSCHVAVDCLPLCIAPCILFATLSTWQFDTFPKSTRRPSLLHYGIWSTLLSCFTLSTTPRFRIWEEHQWERPWQLSSYVQHFCYVQVWSWGVTYRQTKDTARSTQVLYTCRIWCLPIFGSRNHDFIVTFTRLLSMTRSFICVPIESLGNRSMLDHDQQCYHYPY